MRDEHSQAYTPGGSPMMRPVPPLRLHYTRFLNGGRGALNDAEADALGKDLRTRLQIYGWEEIPPSDRDQYEVVYRMADGVHGSSFGPDFSAHDHAKGERWMARARSRTWEQNHAATPDAETGATLAGGEHVVDFTDWRPYTWIAARFRHKPSGAMGIYGTYNLCHPAPPDEEGEEE